MQLTAERAFHRDTVGVAQWEELGLVPWCLGAPVLMDPLTRSPQASLTP